MTHLLLIAIAATSLAAADVSGTWKGTLTPEDGDSGPAYLLLRQEGDAVTGMAGPDETEPHPIRNGKVQDGTITFELESGGGVMRVSLTQNGEELTGEMRRERDGKVQKARLALKRVK